MLTIAASKPGTDFYYTVSLNNPAGKKVTEKIYFAVIENLYMGPSISTGYGHGLIKEYQNSLSCTLSKIHACMDSPAKSLLYAVKMEFAGIGC